MSRQHLVSITAAILVLACPHLGYSAEWGAVIGRFIVDGKPPEPAAPTVTKDKFCVECQPKDQSIQVAKDGSLASAVVWLRAKRGDQLPLPPDDESELNRPVRLSNKQCVFQPHITLLRTGQSLVIANEDPTGHNTRLDLIRNRPFNQLIAAKSEVNASFDVAETKPLPVACNIHAFMNAYVLLRDDPYMAVSDREGRFTIKPMPAGEHELQFWHETGYLKNLDTPAGAIDRRGRLTVTITPGQTLDLGDLRVPAELLSN